MAPPRSIGPRRALLWGATLIALLLGAAFAVGTARRVMSATAGFGKPQEPTITDQIVVERLRDVAKIVSTEMTLRDVVTYEQTRLGSTKRALLVVTGRVSAGIDLERGADVRIDHEARRISVALPPAQIISVDVLNVVTYDERAGLINPFRAEDRDAIQRRTRTQLILAARRSGLLQHADSSAAEVLRNLLSQDGYTVEIRRPVVQRQPTG